MQPDPQTRRHRISALLCYAILASGLTGSAVWLLGRWLERFSDGAVAAAQLVLALVLIVLGGLAAGPVLRKVERAVASLRRGRNSEGRRDAA